MTPINNRQTRDCYYPIYFCTQHQDFNPGYYFFDEEAEEAGEKYGDYDSGFFGPYKTLDEVCKAQYKYHKKN